MELYQLSDVAFKVTDTGNVGIDGGFVDVDNGVTGVIPVTVAGTDAVGAVEITGVTTVPTGRFVPTNAGCTSTGVIEVFGSITPAGSTIVPVSGGYYFFD